jgi:hypothetical protein
VSPLVRIAEERERQAVEAGELDGLPGAGRPLDLDDDRDVPPELRAVYRVLRNAGLVPEGVSLRRDVNALQATLSGLPEGDERACAAQRLALLRLQLETRGEAFRACGYDGALAAKLDR